MQQNTRDKIKKLAKCSFMAMFLAGTLMTVSAYNGKFAFNLSSGWFSPWNVSNYAAKYTTDQSPVD